MRYMSDNGKVFNTEQELGVQILFKKESNEIVNQEETGMRMKGMYAEIDIDYLIESMT